MNHSAFPKTVLRRSLFLLFDLVPNSVWRRWFRLWLASTTNQQPRAAMRDLLEITDDLMRVIDHVAVRYDGGIHAKHRLTKYHDFFVERLKPGERVLDIGCGIGALANSMATQAQAVVVGIDLDAGNIAIAQERFQHPSLTFVEGDALRDLPVRSFETIVISNVLEHIKDRVEFLEMAQERVHPRRWLIRVPMINRHWLVPMRRELGMFYFGDPTHYTEYTPESFAEELHAARLIITHMEINWGEIWAQAEPEEHAKRL